MCSYKNHKIYVGQEYKSKSKNTVIVIINVETYAQEDAVLVYFAERNQVTKLSIQTLLSDYTLSYEAK